MPKCAELSIFPLVVKLILTTKEFLFWGEILLLWFSGRLTQHNQCLGTGHYLIFVSSLIGTPSDHPKNYNIWCCEKLKVYIMFLYWSMNVDTIRERAFECMLMRLGNRVAQEMNLNHQKPKDRLIFRFLTYTTILSMIIY